MTGASSRPGRPGRPRAGSAAGRPTASGCRHRHGDAAPEVPGPGGAWRWGRSRIGSGLIALAACGARRASNAGGMALWRREVRWRRRDDGGARNGRPAAGRDARVRRARPARRAAHRSAAARARTPPDPRGSAPVICGGVPSSVSCGSPCGCWLAPLAGRRLPALHHRTGVAPGVPGSGVASRSPVGGATTVMRATLSGSTVPSASSRWTMISWSPTGKAGRIT